MSEIIYLDDLPFILDEQETELLMKIIPEGIAAIGREWGYADSVFRDNLFEYIIKEILHFNSIDDYYNSKLFKEYKETGELKSNFMLLGETKRFKINFDMLFYDKELNEVPSHHGDFEMVATDLNIIKKNAYFELAKQVFKAGYIVKKLEVTKIEEV